MNAMMVALPTSRSFFAHPDGDHHGVAHLVEERQARIGALRHVRQKDAEVEFLQKDDGRDGYEDRHELRDGDNGVHAGSLFDAARYEEHVEPDEQAGADDRRQVRAAAEDGEEVRKRAEQKRREADRAQKRADPVAPSAVEAQKVAEPRIRIAVDTALQLRLDAREREESHDEAQHPDSRDAPCSEDSRAAGAACSLVARQREHAAADDERDDRGDEAKDAQSSVGLGNARSGGRVVRCGFAHVITVSLMDNW